MFSLADIGAEYKRIVAQLGQVIELGTSTVGFKVDPQVINNAKESLQVVSTGADVLASAKTPHVAGITLGQINTTTNAVVNVLAGLPLPMEAAIPLRIASILLPTAQAAGQLLIDQIHQQSTAAAKPTPAPQPAAPNGRNARSATPRQTPRESTG